MIPGACIGAGVDMITACDIRFGTEDARFCVKVGCSSHLLLQKLSAQEGLDLMSAAPNIR